MPKSSVLSTQYYFILVTVIPIFIATSLIATSYVAEFIMELLKLPSLLISTFPADLIQYGGGTNAPERFTISSVILGKFVEGREDTLAITVSSKNLVSLHRRRSFRDHAILFLLPDSKVIERSCILEDEHITRRSCF